MKIPDVASVSHHMKISTHTGLLPARLCGGFSSTSIRRSKRIVAAQEKALSHSAELFDRADTSKDGKLQLGEVREILRKSSEDYSHFASSTPASSTGALCHVTLLQQVHLPCNKWPAFS